MIQKYFIDNTHRVRLVTTPDTKLAAQEAAAEQAKLDTIRESLTDQDIKRIIHEAVELEKLQEEETDLDVLPMLSLDDVPLDPKDFHLTEEKFGALKIYHHEYFTNQVIYADVSYDLPHIPAEEWPLLRLFASLITQVGCADRNYGKQLEELQSYTGGISAMLGQYPQ